jgi:hypothetical protein
MAGLERNTFSFSFFFLSKKFNLTQNKLRKKNSFTFHFGSIFFLSELIQSLKGGKFPQLKKRV